MKKDSKIYIAGHRGMVGSAIWRALELNGYSNIIGKKSNELDLTSQDAVNCFFSDEKPEYVFLAAAKVGGIKANNEFRGQFLYENLMIQNNVIHESYVHAVKKLMFLGSSCIYPKFSPQPLREEYLLTGELEPTNEPYAIAKIAGIKLCENYRQQYGCNFISVMPTNLYGRGDNYDLNNSHVLPALLRKFHEAKESDAKFVEVWGTGNPLREFMFSDDLASACLFLMENYDGRDFVNIGTGKDISIKDLATLVQKIVEFKGDIKWNTAMPDGTPRKLMDISKMSEMGWKASVTLEKGIRIAYEDFKNKISEK